MATCKKTQQRVERAKQGLCPRCGKPKRVGGSYCVECTDKRRIENREYRKKRKVKKTNSVIADILRDPPASKREPRMFSTRAGFQMCGGGYRVMRGG